jgi:hypothetical protein
MRVFTGFADEIPSFLTIAAAGRAAFAGLFRLLRSLFHA